MPLMLDNIRAEFACFLSEDPTARFRMDAALAHVVTKAYERGLDDAYSVGTDYRHEAKKLRYHLVELAKFSDRAALILATLEAKNSEEEEQIQQCINGISTWAPPAMLGNVVTTPSKDVPTPKIKTAAEMAWDAKHDPSCVGAFARARP